MRVAYTLTRSDTVGGAAVHVRDLARGMLARGHEAVVLVGGEGIFLEQLDERGVPHRRIPHLVGHPFHLWTWPPVLLEFRRAMAEFGPDLVSGHSSNAGFLGRLAAASLGIPRIFTAHGWPFTEGVPGWKRAVFLAGEKTVAPITDRIVTVSEFDRRLALRHGVGPPETVTTVHNGMPDVEDGLEADPTEEPPRLIMVARFEVQKDHGTLLEALARLDDRAWTLDLVGDGPRRRIVERRARELGLADRVRFLGHRDDVAELLADAQLFVLASRWEGFPRSILEAMRAGLPVVASDVGGVSESVADGDTGRVVPPEEPDALAGPLQELLSESRERARMGRAGRERYEERFTFERMFEETLQVYGEVLES